jgi:hypothetical protein
MSASPILLLQWLAPNEYHETRNVLSEFAKKVNIRHANVQLTAAAAQAVEDWLLTNPSNTQYPFIGAHGIKAPNGKCIGIGASGKQDEFAPWTEVWDWFRKGTVSGGLWLGACRSSEAAVALSPLLATALRYVIPYIVGFREEIYTPEIERILVQLIRNTDTDKKVVYLDEELAVLRAAVKDTAVELFYPAHTLAGSVEYVNVDDFEEKVGISFRSHLENQR